MKSRIFKKFHAIDLNEYYSAVIGGEFYLAIRTFVKTVLHIGPFRWRRNETQYFQTIKIPHSIMEMLRSFATWMEGEEETTDWLATLDQFRAGLKRDVITSLYELRESELTKNPGNEKAITKFYADRLLQIYDTYDLSWECDVVNTYLKEGWTFLLQVYAGVATRNIWLAKVNDDLINLMELKVFGNQKASVVVRDERILLDKTIIDAFVKSAEGGN